MKKLLTILILSIFLVSAVSAFEFDNVKNYNQETKTATINNCNFWIGGCLSKGDKIADITLDSENVVFVEPGEDRLVAQFTINNFQNNYQGAIKNMEFYNKNNMKQISRDFNYKYAIYEDVKVDDYKDVCDVKITNNNTSSCENVKTGSHIESQISGWQSFDSLKDLPEGKITIGIFTDVKEGENVEWIPTLFGKRISEWASFVGAVKVEFFETAGGAGGARGLGQSFTIGTTGTNRAYTLVGLSFRPNTDTAATTCNYTIWSDAFTTPLVSNTTNCDEMASLGVMVNISLPEIQLSASTQYWWSVVGNADLNVRQDTSGGYSGGNNYYTTDGSSWNSQPTYDCPFIIWGVGAPIVSLNIPANNTGYSSSPAEITFNGSATSVVGIANLSLIINGIINETIYNSTAVEDLSLQKAVNFSGDGTYNWTMVAYDITGLIGTTETRIFSIDSTPPILNVSSPNETFTYHIIGNNLSLNWSVSDINLQSCWFNYNSANTSLNCAAKNYSFIPVSGFNNLTVYANDTSGNEVSAFTSWDYQILQNSESHNQTIFETEPAYYSVNVTANSSLTAIQLNWNNTNYSLTNEGGGLWDYSRDTPIGNGTYNMSYLFTYGGSIINSTNYTQYVNYTIFTPYSNSYKDVFLNISFQDENDLSIINASIPTSTFTYYLGSGAVNKTLTFVNNTNNFNFVFSGTTGTRALNVLPSVQYRQVSDYPQRIWATGLKNYNTTDTNQILYLLSVSDGLYVTYQVLDSDGDQLSGVDVTASRVVSGETVIVGTGTTDSAGVVTFWMNPDFLNTLVFSKTGYQTFTLSHFPTQSTYTLTMGSLSSTSIADYLKGITYTIQPNIGTTLHSNTTTDFNLTLASSNYSIDLFGFDLYGDGTLITANSSSSSTGGLLTVSVNTSNYNKIKMTYYWTINGTLSNSTTVSWIVFNYAGTSWSIANLVTDITSALTSGIFGLNQASLNFIIFILIFGITGVASYKFSINNPNVIVGLVFGLVFLFDYALGLIDIGIGINNFPTIFMGLALIATILWEVNR